MSRLFSYAQVSIRSPSRGNCAVGQGWFSLRQHLSWPSGRTMSGRTVPISAACGTTGRLARSVPASECRCVSRAGRQVPCAMPMALSAGAARRIRRWFLRKKANSRSSSLRASRKDTAPQDASRQGASLRRLRPSSAALSPLQGTSKRYMRRPECPPRNECASAAWKTASPSLYSSIAPSAAACPRRLAGASKSRFDRQPTSAVQQVLWKALDAGNPSLDPRRSRKHRQELSAGFPC